MNKYQEALQIIREVLHSWFITKRSGEKTLLGNQINTLQELVDKETPKKPSFLNYGGYKLGNWHCPNCDSIIILDSRKPKPPKRCEECDQLLDWSE